jgi:hypothetical protein
VRGERLGEGRGAEEGGGEAERGGNGRRLKNESGTDGRWKSEAKQLALVGSGASGEIGELERDAGADLDADQQADAVGQYCVSFQQAIDTPTRRRRRSAAR